MPTTVLVVDDHPRFLRAAGRMLSAAGFAVVGCASDGEDAVRQAIVLCPDLVLLDVQLPGIDGFEVARRLTELAVAPAVVLTSSREAADYGSAVGEAPACGFLGKHELSAARISALMARVG